MAVSRKAESRLLRKKKNIKTQSPPKFVLPELEAKNEVQRRYINSLNTSDQVFALGPAGCGKTYIATYWGVKSIIEAKCAKMIVTRPMVSSDVNEDIGFLPGDLNSKFAPWALPILDTINKLIGKPKTAEWLRTGVIEFAPFQFMRGRTFDETCIVLLDEAQNCNLSQLRLFLTRLGDCKTIVSGDPTPGQCDIKNSGLTQAVEMVQRHNIAAKICNFTTKEIVRSKLCQSWVEAFEAETVKKGS